MKVRGSTYETDGGSGTSSSRQLRQVFSQKGPRHSDNVRGTPEVVGLINPMECRKLSSTQPSIVLRNKIGKARDAVVVGKFFINENIAPHKA